MPSKPTSGFQGDSASEECLVPRSVRLRPRGFDVWFVSPLCTLGLSYPTSLRQSGSRASRKGNVGMGVSSGQEATDLSPSTSLKLA
jgi:hypothetical protein